LCSLITIPHPKDIVVSFLEKKIVFKDVIFYEYHFGFPLVIITISTTIKPCITLFTVPLLNLGATPP
jgi:hypothetical protein